MKRTTLKQLSQHLGLTQGTVSRAMNDYPDISADTRKRVQAAAVALGYKPNLAARRLATGRAESIAFLMPSESGSVAPFIGELLSGLGDALAACGWDLLLVKPQSGEDEVDDLRKLIGSGRASGVVLSRPQRADRRIAFLRQSKFPFVVHGRDKDCAEYAWYDVDSRRAFGEAVDHLFALGHVRIGLVGAPTYFNFVQDRIDGYRDGLQSNGLTYDPDLISVGELTDEGGKRAALDLLGRSNAPTALLCINDIQAIGALAAIRSLGLEPGQDVSVIGYDGVWMGRHSNPGLATMAQPQAHSGRELGEMLLSIIDGADPKNHQILRHAEFVRRESLGPAPVPKPNVIARSREDIS